MYGKKDEHKCMCDYDNYMQKRVLKKKKRQQNKKKPLSGTPLLTKFQNSWTMNQSMSFYVPETCSGWCHSLCVTFTRIMAAK